MQIAVAAPDHARPAARLEQRPLGRQQRVRARRDAGDLLGPAETCGEAGQIGSVAAHHRGHAGFAVLLGMRLGARVELGDRGSQAFNQSRVDPRLHRQPVEQRCLIEARHLEQPVLDLAVARQREAALRRRSDRQDPPIKLGRRAPVEAQLRGQGGVPRLERPEVEKAVGHGTLQLEGPRADQEDRGGVGVDPLDRLVRRRAIGGWRHQPVEQRRLGVGAGRLGHPLNAPAAPPDPAGSAYAA